MTKEKLPPLREDKSTVLHDAEPATEVQQSVGCPHELELTGYEARCKKCGLGLFVRNYRDFLDLTERLKGA